ncbi:uncharacterized protein LOC128206074 isoform X1 [Mya arenaria]|uniref:uncharacterized protein LOC128206074 isoform X1 n=2 Tax=Mya arenaria TaxID=6604 RepID=UPI0022E1465D|nr:uncharacterized protein LOC128206074 isoform X1 [Mya arenaria]XP_052764176.1 uncharacterized protein LOC128206074 isoform X1 [Mya arenaria]
MVFWIFGLLCLSQTCTAVFIDGLDCSLDCVCCKGGEDHCGYDFGTGRKYCFDGCVDGIYGHRCHNPCPGNCSKCEQVLGKQCYSCKSTFYDIDSDCSKICSVGCDGGVCYVDGKCDTCLPGKYGSHCTLNCTYQNCRCTNGTDCTSCRKGFFGRSTFCQNPCSPGCQDGVCNDDGSCNCRGGFTDNTCSECQAGYYGIYCNISCSVGCVNKSCSKDGTCLCRPNFETSVDGKCETCIPGKYGSNCTLNCTNKNCRCTTETDCISCKKGFFDRSTFCQTPCSLGCQDGVCNDNGSCNCRYGTCIQYECQSGYYGTYCNISCSVGCVNGTCSKDGTCSCRQNFFKEKCNACANGRYDVNCDHIYTSEKFRPHIGAFVGGVSSGIVVIIGIVVALLLFRRRSNSMPAASQTKQNASANERTRFNERQTTYTQLQLSAQAETASENEIYLKIDNESIEALNNGSDDPTYCNEHGTWSKIPIAQLVKYMDGKSHEAFSAEFEIFSHCSAKSYVESQKRENISKNRYKGIYPYDDSRVKVTGSVGSDYINASFIDGYKRPKQYIATLGPMSQQLGDFSLFWKMLWQQKVEKIAMVTNLIERGSHKCEQYWPNPGTTQMFGDIKVESRSEDEYAEFTRRTFTLTMGTEERTLCHLQFTCWPDKAIPDDVTELIEFRQRVQSKPSTLNGPTVVHCSAGVGRTGIYIALDILTEEGEVERAIDILGCVHTIRRNRPNMVQTLEQYKFLHTAVVYSLTFDCSQVKGDNFNQYMKPHSIQELNSQFKRLQHTVKTRCKKEIEAVDRNE